MIVVQILTFRNIHSPFIYMDFEVQSYEFVLDILLPFNLCEDQCIRTEKNFGSFNAKVTWFKEILMMISITY